MSRVLGRGQPAGADLILRSPLNDPELLRQAFGSPRPGRELVNERYFALPPGQRPSLSPFFDSEFYRRTYPDVEAAGFDPYLHFLSFGLDEGRDPHPLLNLGLIRSQWAGDGRPLDAARLAEILRTNPHLLAPNDARRARPGLMGSFDAITDGTALGWAHDPQFPDSRLLVEIAEIVGDEHNVVASGIADVPRADLRAQGIGDGRYHFGLRISDELADGKPHRLRAFVAGQWLDGEHVFQADWGVRRGFDVLPEAETRALARRLSAAWSSPQEAEEFVRRLMASNLMLGTREVAAGLQELRALAAKYPDNALVQLKIGEAQMRLGDAEAASAAFELASRSSELAAPALLGLGNARRALGKWEEAEAHYSRAAEIAPGSPQLSGRKQQLGYLAARSRARECAGAGDLQSAVSLLMPEFLARPGDADLRELVIGMLDSRDGVAAPKSGETELVRAGRSRRLLEAVIAHMHGELGGRE